MQGNIQDALRRRGLGVMVSGSKDQRNVGVRPLLQNWTWWLGFYIFPDKLDFLNLHFLCLRINLTIWVWYYWIIILRILLLKLRESKNSNSIPSSSRTLSQPNFATMWLSFGLLKTVRCTDKLKALRSDLSTCGLSGWLEVLYFFSPCLLSHHFSSLVSIPKSDRR